MSEIMESNKIKSFWKKPQGITGLLFFGALAYGFYKLLPTLITFTENTIYLGLMVGGVAVLSYVILDNKNIIWYGYKLAMYHITRAVYTGIDPIAVAKISIKKLEGKKDFINENMIKLKGNIDGTKRQVEENTISANDKIALAKAAQSHNLPQDASLEGKKAIRLQNWNAKLQPLLDNMVRTYGVLKKMYDMADYIIKDKTDEVESIEKEYKSVKVALSALKSAQDIMGEGQKDEAFEQSMNFVKEDIGNKLGEMDRILEMATPYINNFDLQNAVADDKVNALLSSFNENAFAEGLDNLANKTTNPILITATPQKVALPASAQKELETAHDKYFN